MVQKLVNIGFDINDDDEDDGGSGGGSDAAMKQMKKKANIADRLCILQLDGFSLSL